MKLALGLLALTITAAFSQGPLAPPAAPGLTQKSLQEIWDKIGVLETQNLALQTQLTTASKLDALSPAGLALPWNLTTVDSTGDVGRNASLAFGPDGHPAISYSDVTNVSNPKLKIARYNGNSWIRTTVDDGGGSSSLAFGPDGQPAISHRSGGSLKIARFDGTVWTNTTVDSGGVVGTYSSLAFAPNGQPAISYFDETNIQLKYARYTGTTWSLSIVDATGDVGRFSSLAFGPDGQPAISYYHAGTFDLKFARFTAGGTFPPTPGTWTVTNVATVGTVGEYSSLAYGPDGQPAISYRDGTSIRIARFNGSAWALTTVDALGFLYTSLAFGPDGQPSISHFDASANANLRFSRYTGTAWVNTIVDSPGNVGQYSSLAFGPDGQPAIAYWDETNADLKFARKGVFQPAP